MKAKTFLKPFEAPQRKLKIKFKVNFYFNFLKCAGWDELTCNFRLPLFLADFKTYTMNLNIHISMMTRTLQFLLLCSLSNNVDKLKTQALTHFMPMIFFDTP